MNRTTSSPARVEPVAKEPREYAATRSEVGYLPRLETTAQTYAGLGFKSGLEIHQQLLTEKKLFCHCPAGIYQHGEYDAEVIRHMRPTLSEMGEYDGTALMEKKTRKTIVYRIKDETACTYDIDDTPPFKIDPQALEIALEVALMLQCNIVGELHITRKQYLDGSIPTGFQRTGIVGIEGIISLKSKQVRIIQISLEEDSCREVSDIGHTRVYTTDRLGMPLIETVTYPDMLTPDEVAEAAEYLRLLVRTSGKVRTGIGAAREDVNVSIEGGTRVEIKGVAHIRWIPELTHVEAFRQKSLLRIKDQLAARVKNPSGWKVTALPVTVEEYPSVEKLIGRTPGSDREIVAVNLPQFDGLLSHFTQPGKCFADEISDRLKVIACLERPNMAYSESRPWLDSTDADRLRAKLGAGGSDAQVIFWGPADDMKTAIETVEERCLLAFEGVPNETRKSFPDGTTVFERVLPGPDRMYPDTDSAPIPIGDKKMETIQSRVVGDLPDWISLLRRWKVPEDAHRYLVVNRLIPRVAQLAEETGWPAARLALLFAHTFKGVTRGHPAHTEIGTDKVVDLIRESKARGFHHANLQPAVRLMAENVGATTVALLENAVPGKLNLDQAISRVKDLCDEFDRHARSKLAGAKERWVIGRLRLETSGSVDPAELAGRVKKELGNG